MLSHCATLHKEPAPPAPDLKTQSLPEDIKSLEEIAKKHPDQSMRAKAHLKLAKLYSSYKNPNFNYRRALKELEMYLSFNPPDGKTDEIQNLLAILHELDRMNEENKKLRQKMDQLIEENKELKNSIERLKHLDIKIEEKRKKIK